MSKKFVNKQPPTKYTEGNCDFLLLSFIDFSCMLPDVFFGRACAISLYSNTSKMVISDMFFLNDSNVTLFLEKENTVLFEERKGVFTYTYLNIIVTSVHWVIKANW